MGFIAGILAALVLGWIANLTTPYLQRMAAMMNSRYRNRQEQRRRLIELSVEKFKADPAATIAFFIPELIGEATRMLTALVTVMGAAILTALSTVPGIDASGLGLLIYLLTAIVFLSMVQLGASHRRLMRIMRPIVLENGWPYIVLSYSKAYKQYAKSQRDGLVKGQ